MIVRVRLLDCWSVHDEAQKQSAKQQRILGRRRARVALRRKGRTQDRAHARNTDLYLEEWQDRRRETVNEIAPDPVFPVKLFGVVIFCARAGQSK